MKIGQLASELFKFESVDDDDGRRMTTDGPLVYHKLTLLAFGSGELKIGVAIYSQLSIAKNVKIGYLQSTVNSEKTLKRLSTVNCH